MFILRLHKYIGIAIILTLLIMQAPPANSFYSPTLNAEVSLVKKDLQIAKSKNGNGTLQQAYDKAQQNANEGMTGVFTNAIKDIIGQSLKDSFLDGLSLLFGRWIGTNVWISNCLRDDIWELQALQEQVLAEVLRSSVLNNIADANILWSDYNKLDTDYKILKSDFKNGTLWFPKAKNYYIDCPYGEFTKAWKDVKRAFESFKALGTGSIELGDFKSMAKVAEIRAVKRAQEWLKANQISLTIGGKQGSNPKDILSKDGLKGLAADFKTQMQYVKDMSKLIFSNTYNAFVDMKIDEATSIELDRIVAANQQAYDAAQIAKDQMEATLKYQFTFNKVGENELKEVDKVLTDINFVIQSAVNTKFSKENISTFCEKIAMLLKIQCANKTSGATFTCKK